MPQRGPALRLLVALVAIAGADGPARAQMTGAATRRASAEQLTQALVDLHNAEPRQREEPGGPSRRAR